MTDLKKTMEEFLEYLNVKEPMRVFQNFISLSTEQINGICASLRFVFVTSNSITANTPK
jgi:hypothetical protein